MVDETLFNKLLNPKLIHLNLFCYMHLLLVICCFTYYFELHVVEQTTLFKMTNAI